jgi:hypothetical protein
MGIDFISVSGLYADVLISLANEINEQYHRTIEKLGKQISASVRSV